MYFMVIVLDMLKAIQLTHGEREHHTDLGSPIGRFLSHPECVIKLDKNAITQMPLRFYDQLDFILHSLHAQVDSP